MLNVSYLINKFILITNQQSSRGSGAQTKLVAIMSPGSKIKHRVATSSSNRTSTRSRRLPTRPCPWSGRSRAGYELVSIMALIATALVISLVIGQPIQPADGQSATSTGSNGIITTTASTSSSSVGARGLKRASQQRPAAQQQVADQQQQQQQQLTMANGMAPFYSIKDGKTSVRRIQQQQQQPASPFALQRNTSSSLSSSMLARQNLANDGQRKLQDMAAQDWRQTAGDEGDALDELAGQDGPGSGRTAMMTSTGGSGESELRNMDQETPARPTTTTMADTNKPGEFNQLAPMSGQQQQQQLANMMSIGSFNQLVASSGANRLGDFKPPNGDSSMDAGRQLSSSATDEEADDMKQQQQPIQSTTSSANEFPSSTSSSSGGNGEPAQAGNRSPSMGANEADFRQSTPIKQSAREGTKQSNKRKQQQPTQQLPGMQSIQQQQQGAPNSNSGQLQTSSLSMSLDGMVMNSRPRASGATGAELQTPINGGRSGQRATQNKSLGNKSSGQQGTRTNEATRQQQVSASLSSPPPPPTTTMGTLGGDSTPAMIADRGSSNQVPLNRVNQQQQQQNNQLPAAGNMRRVPFSGVPFSSPASKGQRTKPKASNQFGGFSSTTTTTTGLPESMARQQQQQQAMSPRQQAAGFMMVGDNSADNSARGRQQPLNADDEQQQQQQKVAAMNLDGESRQISGAGEELINSVMQSLTNMNNNNNGQMRPAAASSMGSDDASLSGRFNQVATSKLPNGDMLMSVISSDDGRERKLVMISRDTLDSLQRFADQQQPQQQQQPIEQQQVQKTEADSTGGASGAGMTSWWPSTTTSSTISTSTGARQQQFEQPTTAVNSQQAQRQQTTTLMPVSFSTSVAATQTPSEGPDNFGSTTVSPNDEEPISTGSGVTTSAIGTGNNNNNDNADTFREVSVKQANITNGQKQVTVAAAANKQQGQAPARGLPARQQQQTGSSSRASKQKQVSGTKAAKAKSKQTLATGVSGGPSGALGSTTTLSSGANDNGTREQTLKTGRQQQQSGRKQTVDGQTNGNTLLDQRVATPASSDSSSAAFGGAPMSSTSSETGAAKSNGSSTASSTKSKQKKTNGQQKSSGNGKQEANGVTTTTTTTPSSTTKRTKSSKTQKSSSNGQQKQQAASRPSSAKGQSTARKQSGTGNGEGGSTVTQTSAGQQPTTTSTQAPNFVQPATSGTNGQQLPKGRLASGASVQSPGSELDSSSMQEEEQEGRRPGVEILETNRRQNGSSSTMSDDGMRRPQSTSGSGTGSGSVSQTSNSRAELDRQLDEMERANAADADNQAAAMADSERTGGSQQREGASTNANGGPMSELDGLRAAIPGEPLVDYPIYSEPPARSSFQCQAQSCPGGYYADPDSQCQVFHVCQSDGRMDTFLCPNGTIFSQQHFVCVWWWQVDCSLSRSFYKLNDAIYCNSMELPAGPITGTNEMQTMGLVGPTSSLEGEDLRGSAPSFGQAEGVGSQDDSQSAAVNMNAMPQQQQQQQSQQQDQTTTTNRRNPSKQRSNNNNMATQTGTNGMSLVSSTMRTTTDGPTTTTTDTAVTGNTNAGRLSTGAQSTRQQQQPKQQSTNNNQFEGTSTQMALINLDQEDQQGQEVGSASRNQTATGDNLNESDMNQQQQQQLELLSRRAA